MEFSYKIVNSLEELEHFKTDTPTFADTEAGGLYIDTRLIQLYQPSTDKNIVYMIDTDIIDFEEAKGFLKPLWTVWHNASFDLGALNITTATVDDTLYLCKTAYPEWANMKCPDKHKPYGLYTVAVRLGLDYLYAGIDKKALQSGKFLRGQYLSQSQLKYAAVDAYILHLIYTNKRIQAARDNLAYKVDIIALKEVVVWQQNGLPILRDVYERYLHQARIERDEAIAKLDGLNPRSASQVKKALGTDKADKPTLMRLYINQGSRLAGDIMTARKALNDISQLGKYNHHRVYGRFNPAGAKTGRWSCTGGDLEAGTNLQNYPRQFKGIFGVPRDSDMILITADYSTAELRAAAAIYKEANMYKALKEGRDLHKHTASLIYNIPIEQVDGRQRSNAKVANFGFCFGLSAKTFVDYAFDLYGLEFTLEEAQELRNQWFAAYPAVARYHKMCWNAMSKGGYITQTALGRRVAPKLGTDAINIPVQGTVAETMKLAIHYMVKEDARTLKYLVNSIHDAVYFIAPEAEANYWGDLIKRCMIKGWTEMSKRPLMYYKDIPMPIDVAYGKTMSDLSDDFEGGGQALSLDEMKELKGMN